MLYENLTSTTGNNNPYRLKSLGVSQTETHASKGMYRAILTIDSEPYQVGKDWESAQKALDAIRVVIRASCTYQIYDDHGNPMIDENGDLV